ncbi:phosphoribosylglycinamide formyltransferase [Desulfovibrio ferrophilus]|uniref:Phosphoribosylglycinamide formyltransferase n=1 Tax=Desulfovibrio ferrophilus TaxID=241368 RepID=A0A2Z6B2Y7_9BACT|nr:phosphoribosylglycinamide formyltransferase [Desulfovibrio ferrophilus]BBD09808.1 phosphoribosylglycinamide formyltransferase [Desulfovibrio ferrophilus]
MALKLAVLVSGGGSNLQSIIDRIEDGALDAEIKLVLSNKPDAYGLTRAEKHGLPSVALDHTAYESREAFDAAMVEKINACGADIVVLAGFMRLLTSVFINAFKTIVNIHPALLPSFAGCHGQRDAADYGVKISGATVHFVDEIMDHGPVIVQAAVPVLSGEDGDALGARILEFEHRIYPQALQWLAEGRVTVKDRHVFVADAGKPKAPITKPGLVNPPLEEGF